jgi:predicted ArsR family transcriptional regulator
VQRRLLDLVAGQGEGLTVAAVAGRLGLSERRARTVVASLAHRRLVATTVERIGTQPSGRPVHGLLVWNWGALDDAEFLRFNQRRYARIQAETAAAIAEHEARMAEWAERIAARRCPCCGRPLCR